MKLFVTIPKEVEAKYLKMDVAVRYGEDDMSNDAALREGDSWRALINLEEGRVEDWPKGKTLSFKDMKICDEGIYILLDADRKEITRIEGYVPNELLPGDYGDYLSLDIAEDGKITNWMPDATLEDFEADSE